MYLTLKFGLELLGTYCEGRLRCRDRKMNGGGAAVAGKVEKMALFKQQTWPRKKQFNAANFGLPGNVPEELRIRSD